MESGSLQRVAERARALPLAGGRLALALAALAVAQPAAAAQTASGFGRAEVLSPVTVGGADMDFGISSPRGTNGTVVMTPAESATCTATGTIVRTPTAVCRAAKFEGNTAFLFFLRVTKPVGGQITLTGPSGATMRVDNFTFAGGPGTFAIGATATEQRFVILNGDGSFTVYVGGTLNIAGNQRPGVYTGTFQLSFNYD